MSYIPTEIHIDRDDGRGPYRFILVPGLVPDGPETFHMQRKVLRKHGGLVTLTYPYTSFDQDRTITVITEEIARAHREKAKPVMVGVSVGGGLALEVLRRAREQNRDLNLSGVILISPLSGTADLSPLLNRLLKPIMDEHDKDGGNPTQALNRGRHFFKTLAMKSAGPRREVGFLQQLLGLITPSGYDAKLHDRIRDRVERSMELIDDRAALERVTVLRRMRGIHDLTKQYLPVTEAPVMILWGAKERNTLNMDGPGTSLLSRPDLAARHFSNLEVQWVYNSDGEEAPHASLLKHAKAFNKHIKRFCKRLGKNRRRDDDD